MSDAGFATERVIGDVARGGVFNTSHGSDSGLYVEFYMESVYQEAESKKQGRQIYKDVPHILIMQPGGKSEIRRLVRMEATDRDPPDTERFPRQWAAFMNQQTQVQTGTPLEEWPILSKARVMELKAVKIYTVEQLSSVPDSTLHNFGMDGRQIRDQAKAFLNKAEAGAALSKANAEIESLKAELAGLKASMANFASQPAEAPQKRGPGRPRKEQSHGDQS